MTEYTIVIVGDADRWWTTMTPEERKHGYMSGRSGRRAPPGWPSSDAVTRPNGLPCNAG